MFRALALATADLADRRILGILIRSLLVTLALFAVLGLVLLWLLQGADPCGWIDAGACPLDASTSGIGAVALTLVGLWLLFPPIAIGVVTAYGDAIVAAVETRHYPAAAARARPPTLFDAAWLGLRSSLRVIACNLLALPFYLLLLVTGVGTVALFVVVNGVALGRDLGVMVAARHDDRAARRGWLRSTRLERGLIGAAVTALFLVPLANLVAPILGAAAMAHLYHRR